AEVPPPPKRRGRVVLGVACVAGIGPSPSEPPTARRRCLSIQTDGVRMMDQRRRRQCVTATCCAGLLVLAFSLAAGRAAAQFYIGPSYLRIPGVASAEPHRIYKDWVRAES